ncbi:MAG: hypothetical protein DRN20_02385, partial [Thermoplasmata archaeon]
MRMDEEISNDGADGESNVRVTRTPSAEEFLNMDRAEIRNMVASMEPELAVCIVADATRRAGIILYGLDPRDEYFEARLYEKIHGTFLRIIEALFELGAKSVFVPLLKNENFMRGKRFVEHSLKRGIRYLLTNNQWLEFYDRYDIALHFYGDLSVLMNEYRDVFGEIEVLANYISPFEYEGILYSSKISRRKGGRRIYFGIACSSSYEYLRMFSLLLNHYEELCPEIAYIEHCIHYQRTSTGDYRKQDASTQGIICPSTYAMLEDLRKIMARVYYGAEIGSLHIFIRPAEVRDSDLQPILISGKKTQLYFPVAPITVLGEEHMRRILHDYLFM